MVNPFPMPFSDWGRKVRPWQVGILTLSTAVLVACSPGADQANSNGYERQLANYLTSSGAAMYGAYWCPHCADQKEMFKTAVELLPYVECDPEGDNPQPQLCQEKGIQGYPTWEIGGELYPGVHSLDELARLSGFRTPQ